MTEHYYRRRSDGLPFIRREDAPVRRLHAEHGEVIAADQFDHAAFSFAVYIQADDVRDVGDHIGEDFTLIADVRVVEIRRPVRRLGTLIFTGQHDQSIRLSDRQRFEQVGIDDTENRRVRADAERKRERGDKSKAGTLHQRQRSVTQVLKHFVLRSPRLWPQRIPQRAGATPRHLSLLHQSTDPTRLATCEPFLRLEDPFLAVESFESRLPPRRGAAQSLSKTRRRKIRRASGLKGSWWRRRP